MLLEVHFVKKTTKNRNGIPEIITKEIDILTMDCNSQIGKIWFRTAVTDNLYTERSFMT